ncbi:bacterioferritin [Seohaeicola saemankumensis]|nr:bacterioferritin [Seohaeicola saemankumensis]MCA0873638.1 bacterioferritin [Seohaeicola saemankumensis]
MPDKSKSLENLQTALSMELAASNQYLLHAHVLDDWGLDILAAKMREEMTEELGHAGLFIERILFLGGDPVLTPEKTPQRAQSLKDMFAADKADEKDAIAFYTRAARQAYEADDIGSRRLFEQIALDEEGHWSWLDLQMDLLDRMGEPAFIAKYMSIETGTA